ncbi:MAG: hypothetical protein A2Y10_13300 [Planctomycetes bacterium GWF2_41_51]|nr:MAG: hypothetical protein A2Y10_13300 [Planctomycetes bacterium GWF2_41_51]HBG26290.1 hypothetical protein [Phycisphaerales bacterium]
MKHKIKNSLQRSSILKKIILLVLLGCAVPVHAWIGDPSVILSPSNPYLAQAESNRWRSYTYGVDIFWICWGYAAPESTQRGNSSLYNAAITKVNELTSNLAANPEPMWDVYEALECVYILNRYTGYKAPSQTITTWLNRLAASVAETYDLMYSSSWEAYAPNAMAQAAAILQLASILYNNSTYANTAGALIDEIYADYKTGGGGLYYLDQAASIQMYYGFELVFVGRYYQLTHDSTAENLIKYMAGYAKDIMDNGVIEGSTAAHWKDGWAKGGPLYQFEICAGVDHDSLARAVAAYRESNFAEIRVYLYPVMYFWDSSLSSGTMAPDFCRYNFNVSGPQLRYGRWQVTMCSASRSDTGIGCVKVGTSADSWSGYLDVANLQILKNSSSPPNATDGSYYVMWPGSSTSIVAGNWIASAGNFYPRSYFTGGTSIPAQNQWRTKQVWFGDKEGMSGYIITKTQTSTSTVYGPRGYINTSHSPSLNGTSFTAGELSYKVFGPDIASLTTSGGGSNDVWVNLTGVSSRSYPSGDDYGYGLSCRNGTPYNIIYISQGNGLLAFTVDRPIECDITLVYNDTGSTQTFSSVSPSGKTIYRSGTNGVYSCQNGTGTSLTVANNELVAMFHSSSLIGIHFAMCKNGNQYLHNDSSSAGGRVTTYYYHSDYDSEKWDIQPMLDGTYRLRNLRGGGNLYMATTGTGSYAPIITAVNDESSVLQKWAFVSSGSDYRFKTFSANMYVNDESNIVLDDLYLYDDRPTWNSQIWTLTRQ